MKYSYWQRISSARRKRSTSPSSSQSTISRSNYVPPLKSCHQSACAHPASDSQTSSSGHFSPLLSLFSPQLCNCFSYRTQQTTMKGSLWWCTRSLSLEQSDMTTRTTTEEERRIRRRNIFTFQNLSFRVIRNENWDPPLSSESPSFTSLLLSDDE